MKASQFHVSSLCLFLGRTVYEWDQTLDEVNIYIPAPPKISAKLLSVKIEVNHVTVGMVGNPPYLSVRVLIS